MPLFEFSLKPLDKVAPWEGDRPNERRLSWFGLTDGSYSINANGSRLFQYTPEIMGFWDRPYRENGQFEDWVDCQVVRLYEDLLELLPYIMAAVPRRAHEMVCTVQRHRSWMSSLSWALDIDDDPNLDELYRRATDGFGYRGLDAGYLTEGPSVWFWRFEDTMHLQWDNGGKQIDGIPLWAASAGDCSMSVDAFWSELESFHTRLMSAMAERVETIKTQNPLPHVRIDVDQLIKEHAARTRSLAEAKVARPRYQIDWDVVFAANDKLANYPRKPAGSKTGIS